MLPEPLPSIKPFLALTGVLFVVVAYLVTFGGVA